jgi:hypothetical protein
MEHCLEYRSPLHRSDLEEYGVGVMSQQGAPRDGVAHRDCIGLSAILSKRMLRSTDERERTIRPFERVEGLRDLLLDLWWETLVG